MSRSRTGDTSPPLPPASKHLGLSRAEKNAELVMENRANWNPSPLEVDHCSYGPLPVISTYNPIYRMYNPIYNQL